MAANEAVDALQDELGALTCEEQNSSLFSQLPRCVFIALAQRYLTATQRAALAASERYAREELVTNGDLAPSVWRVTWLSQAAAVKMLSTVPPRAYAPLRWTSELVLLDSDTQGFSRTTLGRYWQGLSLFVDNAPALTMLRMRKPWRLSPLVFAAVARRPVMRLEVPTLTPKRLVDFDPAAGQLVREDRLTCPKLVCDCAWPSWWRHRHWLDLLKQATLVELDLSDNRALGELPEAIATLGSLRVLRANRMVLQEPAVLARGPPALEVLALNGSHMPRLPTMLACAASLVRLELWGTSVSHSFVSPNSEPGSNPPASHKNQKQKIKSSYCDMVLDLIKGLPKLRFLLVTYELYDQDVALEELAAHPCFVPSALEYVGDELGNRLFWRARECMLDAVRAMSPCQKKDIEVALAALERALPEAQLEDPSDGSSWERTKAAMARDREVLEEFLVRLREALAGKPAPAAMERDGLAAAPPPQFAFRAPSPVVEVSPAKPFVFGASAAEERVVTPETHSDKPFAFGANASGREEPFVFGAKLDK